MYPLIKKCLFCFDAEKTHHFALHFLHVANKLHLSTLLFSNVPARPKKVMGLLFPNQVGLSAGFDRNGDYIEALSALGFGFIEIGTVVPKPQAGNARPRIFRLIEQEALINRVGFASKGVAAIAQQLEKTRYRGILGINIGKNKDTANDEAIHDYLISFRMLWKYASYITINVSSPNTPGLRDLQQADSLTLLLNTLKEEQKKIAAEHEKYVPLVVKISPDLAEQDLTAIARVLLEQKIDGVIATNTTLSREGVENSPYAKEAGGLSGKPLQSRSTWVIAHLHKHFQGNIPIIASGGVMDAQAASEKLQAGASLLQIYTGFIYRGPTIIKSLAVL